MVETSTTDTMMNTVVPLVGLGIMANMAGNMMRPQQPYQQQPVRRKARRKVVRRRIVRRSRKAKR